MACQGQSINYLLEEGKMIILCSLYVNINEKCCTIKLEMLQAPKYGIKTCVEFQTIKLTNKEAFSMFYTLMKTGF